MADVQALMAQMQKASQAAHEELDLWMTDAGGTPDSVNAKVQTYRQARASWVEATTEVAPLPPTEQPEAPPVDPNVPIINAPADWPVPDDQEVPPSEPEPA